MINNANPVYKIKTITIDVNNNIKLKIGNTDLTYEDYIRPQQ